MRLAGAPAEVIAEWRQVMERNAASQRVEVWPEHWHAACLFEAMGTQWRAQAGPQGLVWLGLDYSALPSARGAVRARLPRQLRQPWPELFAQLRTMEVAALRERNRQ